MFGEMRQMRQMKGWQVLKGVRGLDVGNFFFWEGLNRLDGWMRLRD